MEIVDGGIFTGKYLSFSIEIPEIKSNIKRTENDFKTLCDLLKREFPTIPIPPLVRVSKDYSDLQVVTLFKKNFEMFLNHCFKHPEIKNSPALENFLIAKTPEEFASWNKEIKKFYKKAILLKNG